MRKILIALMITLGVSSIVNAQEFRKFKFETGLLYGLPSDDAYDSGIGYYMHPSYYLNDQLNVGLKLEWAILGGADEAGTSVDVSAIGSYLVTSNYYFNTNRVRPYAGLGIGLYSLGSVDMESTYGTASVDYGNKFGVAPTVGLDMAHFTVKLSYNAIMGIDSELAGKNYLSIGVGVFFGGGKK